ncbi:MAG: hypothetical protein ACPGSL_01070 [Vicingaceae bacterium]
MRKIISKIYILPILLLMFLGCSKNEPVDELDDKYKIVLNMYQNDSETKAEFETGLKWCFSFLGAQLKNGSWEKSTKWIDNQRIEIDTKELGFNNSALKQLSILITIYKNSEEYRVTKGIDAGRFVVSTFNNPNHYYKIVNMPKQLQAFETKYDFLQKKAAIVESAVAFGERRISLPNPNNNINSIGYLAEELTGSLADSTHIVKEFEVMDIMENGQLRFGIYNTNNQLINGADPNLSSAGKPAKCLWCHEVNIQKGFAAQTAINGYFSPNQFDSIIIENQLILNEYRSILNTEIDFLDNLQHIELEKLYIRFMEPSAKRLAAEWNMTEGEVSLKLSGFTTHTNNEFNSLGDLYNRFEIENYAPYQVIPSTTSARETVNYEPNLLP